MLAVMSGGVYLPFLGKFRFEEYWNKYLRLKVEFPEAILVRCDPPQDATQAEITINLSFLLSLFEGEISRNFTRIFWKSSRKIWVVQNFIEKF